jgi:hypothetical protein
MEKLQSAREVFWPRDWEAGGDDIRMLSPRCVMERPSVFTNEEFTSRDNGILSWILVDEFFEVLANP